MLATKRKLKKVRVMTSRAKRAKNRRKSRSPPRRISKLRKRPLLQLLQNLAVLLVVHRKARRRILSANLKMKTMMKLSPITSQRKSLLRLSKVKLRMPRNQLLLLPPDPSVEPRKRNLTKTKRWRRKSPNPKRVSSQRSQLPRPP